jgi:TRAP-type mannitol/chloroaromatic compound transport system permease small subunit
MIVSRAGRSSWLRFEINEQSGNAGGLAQWPAKFLVPLAFFLLFLQGFPS